MKFWDSSAIVPLLVEEAFSAKMRHLLRADRHCAVWALTELEVVSALGRQERSRSLAAADLARARGRLEAMAKRWVVVDDVTTVATEALRLVAAYPVRAADASQLAAALVFFGGHTRGRGFVTLDDRLSDAAGAEGFDVVGPG